jgi:hypothetical protein
MSSRRAPRLVIGALSTALMLGTAALVDAQFTPFNDRSRAMLEGNWQSCRESDGGYSERIYDGKWPGLPPFELHLGPFHDFALFQGLEEEHRDHDSGANLLVPHTVDLELNRAGHTWDVAGLHVQVVLSGGSREECESWYVRMLPINSSSH